LDLRIEIEREARRMAGYWHGRRIAEAYMGLIAEPLREGDLQKASEVLNQYLQARDDPRLAEIMGRLQEIMLDSSYARKG
jgi:succinate dehydrogenase/fumarate reductase flavoprotein subunit